MPLHPALLTVSFSNRDDFKRSFRGFKDEKCKLIFARKELSGKRWWEIVPNSKKRIGHVSFNPEINHYVICFWAALGNQES